MYNLVYFIILCSTFLLKCVILSVSRTHNYLHSTNTKLKRFFFHTLCDIWNNMHIAHCIYRHIQSHIIGIFHLNYETAQQIISGNKRLVWAASKQKHEYIYSYEYPVRGLCKRHPACFLHLSLSIIGLLSTLPFGIRIYAFRFICFVYPHLCMDLILFPKVIAFIQNYF